MTMSPACLLLVLSCSLASMTAGDVPQPTIIWTSDPVLPDETLMLIGGGFGNDAQVQVARLKDDQATSGTAPDITTWTTLRVLQRSATSLKAPMPAGEPGVFACRVLQGGTLSPTVLVNAPDPWWVLGDGGGHATAGGWIKVFGRSLHLAVAGATPGKPAPLVRLVRKGGGSLTAACARIDACQLTVALPKQMAPGPWTVQVHNGRGDGGAWREAGQVTVLGPSRPGPVFDVGMMGLDKALAEAARQPGGTVLFPHGHWRMKGPLNLAAGTTLRGAGRELVSLHWGDQDKAPEALITGERLAIEDLTITVQNAYRHVIKARTADFRMERVRVRANPFFMLGHHGHDKKGHEFRTRDLKGPYARVGAVVLLDHVDGFSIADCDLLAGRHCIDLEEARNGVITRCEIRYGMNGLGIEASRRVLVEDCTIAGNDLEATGNYIATYFGNAAECLAISGCRFTGVWGYDREMLTFDAAAGAYLGTVAAVAGTTVTLAADPKFQRYKHDASDWTDTALCVLDGTGAGQYRRVVRHQGRAWEVDRPFSIPPQTDSVISIVPFRGRVLILGNTFSDGGAVQLYGMSIDCILAGNRGERMGGFSSWGRESKGWGWQPSWYCQFLDQTIAEGNSFGYGNTSIRSETGFSAKEHEVTYPGPLCRGLVLRRNHIANHGDIRIEGRLQDALVEGNLVEHAEQGLVVGGQTGQVLLRGNRCVDVKKPLGGDGLKRTVVVER